MEKSVHIKSSPASAVKIGVAIEGDVARMTKQTCRSRCEALAARPGSALVLDPATRACVLVVMEYRLLPTDFYKRAGFSKIPSYLG
jgi:hypothetical protein